jgi:Asp-tRNA(Asn)/Glu-tRNA(Gln) amidotransferase A subunit family amidase
MADELAWEPAWRVRQRIAAKEVSPVEMLELTLDRVARLDPQLHAFLTVAADQAMDDAREAEAAVARGDDLGPLHGVPISIKDMIDTKAIRSTSGSLVYADRHPERDAVIVERVRAAGAIVFGKTNTPEFGAFVRTVNRLAPETVNPWDTRRSAGASSGGSAAAVAAGLGPIALGTDGGGSTRLPAAINGVVGVFPTRGLVPGYTTLFSNSQSAAGPITRDVLDAATVLQVIAGPTDRDPLTRTGPPVGDYVGELDAGVQGVRMAWSGDFGRVRVHQPEVVDTVHETARLFAGLGAVLEEPQLHLPDTFDTLAVDQSYTLFAPGRLPARPGVPSLQEFLATLQADPETWVQLTPGVRHLDPTYLDYVYSIPPSVRNAPIDRPEDILERFDILLSPTISRVAIVCEDTIDVPSWTEYTFTANILGYPALSVPAGFVDGLPVGLHLMGRPGSEGLLLRAARALEQAAPWAQHRPPVS